MADLDDVGLKVPSQSEEHPNRSALSTHNSSVLSLQPLVGNAAISAAIQRSSHTTPPQPLNPSDLDGTLEIPKSSSSKPQPLEGSAGSDATADALVVQSDMINFAGTISVREKPPDEPAGLGISPVLRVGFIQTLDTTGRVGHYTTDGTPEGPKYADVRIDVAPGTRDVKGMREKPGGKVEQAGTPPFYDYYQEISRRGDSQTLHSADRLQAAFAFEIDGGKGKLVSTSGLDRFRISLAGLQPPRPPMHVKAAEWAQDWSMAVDPAAHSGVGKPFSVEAFKGDVSKLGEPQGAVNWDARMWTAVKSPEAVHQLSAPALMNVLTLARQQDNEAYELIATELRIRNPSFRFSVRVTDDAETLGDNDIQLQVEGKRGARVRHATIGSGPFATDVAEFSFGLLDFFDPNDVTADSVLKLSLIRSGHGSETTSQPYPFAGRAWDVRVDGATYVVNIASFAG